MFSRARYSNGQLHPQKGSRRLYAPRNIEQAGIILALTKMSSSKTEPALQRARINRLIS